MGKVDWMCFGWKIFNVGNYAGDILEGLIDDFREFSYFFKILC